jgi:hypothetical protein
MTHLEDESESFRAKSKKVFEQRAIEFKVGRELNEDGAEVIAVVENAGNFEETLQSALTVAEPLNVGDLLVDLQGEAKAFRYALGPVQERILGGHAIEAVIDFDRRELLRVKGEHFTVGKFVGIKISLPLLVGVSGSADTKLTRPRNRIPPWSTN